jgi:dihydropyrimidinase
LLIYAETCPQYLWLLSERLKGENFEGTSLSLFSFHSLLILSTGSEAVCSPPPRDSVENINALWQGIANGTFTTFASDHAATK